ncbi:MAG: FAD-binding oxidoreductase [Planctomycetaceae bacterium]|nr:FAD-binding oxidoreductase [Planctomycetaceae bacterium]
MSPVCVETLIVGQGLAGTVLAWHLSEAGESVRVMDEGQPVTSSRIAAGLVTPITGQRLVPSWRFAEFWPKAVAFYRRVEARLGQTFFREVPMVRLFQNETERERVSRALSSESAVPVRFPEPLVNDEDFQDPWGGFEMTGGQLDVPGFLSASRQWWEATGSYHVGRLQLPEDLEIHPQGVRLPRWNLEAKRVLFCQGFAARNNPWFVGVPFDPAKGEILTVRVPGLEERRVMHCGIWLASLGEELFRVGATYDRDHLAPVPTDGGRTEITTRLQSLLKRPFEVVEHHAAVRPIVVGRHPVVGMHPRFPQLGYFNGLGSKGRLQAPFIADQFAKFLQVTGHIDEAFNVQTRFGKIQWND